MPGQHLVQHDADPVHVRGRSDVPALGLLRRHVARGTDDGSRPGIGAPLGQPRHAEVGHLDPAVMGDQHIAGLDVPVHDALRVRGSQRTRQLLGDVDRLPGAERTVGEPVDQALAIHQLGHVVDPLRRRSHIVDLDDARVADAGQQLRLALEATHPIGVLSPPGLDYLDGDNARQPPVAAAIDAAERALANDSVELVAPIEREAGEIGCARQDGQFFRETWFVHDGRSDRQCLQTRDSPPRRVHLGRIWGLAIHLFRQAGSGAWQRPGLAAACSQPQSAFSLPVARCSPQGPVPGRPHTLCRLA